MGFLDRFIDAIIGATGAHRRLRKFDPKHNAEFLPALKPATVILTWPTYAGVVGGAIQGGSDSVFTHVIGYIDPEKFVEATYPEVREGNILEYLRDDVQMIAFIFDLAECETDIILDYVYGKIGTNYDLHELFSDAFPLFGISHPAKEHVCASLWSTAYAMAGRSIVKPDINPLQSSPRDINDFLYPNREIKIATWNWNPYKD